MYSNLGQVVHTHVPLSPSSIIWYQLLDSDALCGWEGNRRSGIAGHASTDLSGLSTYRLEAD